MRHHSLPAALVALSAVMLIAPRPAAQSPQGQQPASQSQPQPPVTFRAEANFVEVHAIVTGPDGAFVRGLTADDFEIFEDGRPVKPAVFQLIDVPIDETPAPLNAAARVEPDIRETRRTFDGRIYVLLLDDLHTTLTRTQHVRDVAKRFVQQYLGADDLA